MSNYRFVLEPLTQLELDKIRSRVKDCACGKSNKDGKFVPFRNYDDRGYCHSCGLWFNVAVYTCHNCKAEHAFSRYIDTAHENAYLASHVGKCLYCGYHYTPKQFFEDTKDESAGQQKPPNKVCASAPKKIQPSGQPVEKPASTIPIEYFKQSLQGYEGNNFVQYLVKLFGTATAKTLIEKYYIGSSRHWQGATVFWQIDEKGKIPSGKIMLYNQETGKRVKKPFNHIQWVHKALNVTDFNLQQCFFGAHLLHGNRQPVAIVESEKTAIIASVYLPQFVWLAAGNKQGLTLYKCKCLAGRTVVLYPDLNAFDLWSQKANEFSHVAAFTVSDLLERKATETEKSQGLDLADYLIRFPVSASEKKVDPVALLITDVFKSMGETHTTKEFNRLIIAGIKMKDGSLYDIILNGKGELIKQGEESEAVQQLATFFEKKLIPVVFDNVPCWAHKYN